MQKDINDLEKFLDDKEHHYGYYEPIDKEIEKILLKYINKNEYFFDLCSDKFVDNLGTKYFKNAWDYHKNEKQYFPKLNWIDSLVFSLSWLRYH
jgi:hypothetical protein